MYKALIKPWLFRKSPEEAHHYTFRLIKRYFTLPLLKDLIRGQFAYSHPSLRREVFGLTFENPVGLAAGFDKDAVLIEEMAALGFGFIEIGTLTPRPQAGNPQPRLFRLPQDEALINRMGFNNGGVEEAVARLRQRKTKVLIGGNIGKNKDTPNEEAYADYLYCFRALYEVVDYFVVNVSSPNTPNLRALQEKAPLQALLSKLMEENRRQERPKPLLLKIAPDLTNGQLDDIIDIVKTTGIDGIIATNTTISREGLQTPAAEVEAIGAGGLSGKTVRARSTEVIRYLHTQSGGSFPIIGVGGIFTAEDAYEKLQAGASLVQVYSGMIYEGPYMIKRIKEGLARKFNTQA